MVLDMPSRIGCRRRMRTRRMRSARDAASDETGRDNRQKDRREHVGDKGYERHADDKDEHEFAEERDHKPLSFLFEPRQYGQKRVERKKRRYGREKKIRNAECRVVEVERVSGAERCRQYPVTEEADHLRGKRECGQKICRLVHPPSFRSEKAPCPRRKVGAAVPDRIESIHMFFASITEEMKTTLAGRSHCAVSRILSWAAMYLGWSLPTTSSGTFVRSNWFPTNTALHRSKNFAVAPTPFDVIIPEGILPLSGSASLFASLASRRTGVTRYPAAPKGACVRTFLQLFRVSGCLAQKCRVPRA